VWNRLESVSRARLCLVVLAGVLMIMAGCSSDDGGDAATATSESVQPAEPDSTTGPSGTAESSADVAAMRALVLGPVDEDGVLAPIADCLDYEMMVLVVPGEPNELVGPQLIQLTELVKRQAQDCGLTVVLTGDGTVTAP
jgi:hypothetical protein